MTKSVVGIIGCILKVICRVFVGGVCPGCKKEGEVKDETLQGKK